MEATGRTTPEAVPSVAVVLGVPVLVIAAGLRYAGRFLASPEHSCVVYELDQEAHQVVPLRIDHRAYVYRRR